MALKSRIEEKKWVTTKNEILPGSQSNNLTQKIAVREFRPFLILDILNIYGTFSKDHIIMLY